MTVRDVTLREVRVRAHDGVALRAFEAGPANAACIVVFAPPGTSGSFVAPAVRLLARSYRVVTWETRLILEPGVALPDPGALSLESLLRDVECVRERLGVASAGVIGYCSGAALALHAAARDERALRAGERDTRWIERLALVNGAYFLPGGACEQTPYERDVLALMPHVAAGTTPAAYVVDAFRKRRTAARPNDAVPADVPPDAVPPDDALGDELQRPYRDAVSLYRLAVVLDRLIAADVRSAVPEAGVPALVVSGERDVQAHPASSRLVAGTLRDAALWIGAATDHYAFARGDEELVERIAASFAQTPARAPEEAHVPEQALLAQARAR